MIDPELVAIMSSVVQLTPPTGQDSHGQQTYGSTPVASPRCHLKYAKSFMKRDPQNTEPTIGTAYLDGVYGSVDTTWRVTLPAGAPLNGKTAYIADVKTTYDETGPYQTVLTIGAR